MVMVFFSQAPTC